LGLWKRTAWNTVAETVTKASKYTPAIIANIGLAGNIVSLPQLSTPNITTKDVNTQWETDREVGEKEKARLAERRDKQIAGLRSKVRKPRGVQYALIAKESGEYTTVRGNIIKLEIGDVYKYGESTKPEERYSQKLLREGRLEMQREYYGDQTQIKIVEKAKIFKYFFEHGRLPPGNKIFR